MSSRLAQPAEGWPAEMRRPRRVDANHPAVATRHTVRSGSSDHN